MIFVALFVLMPVIDEFHYEAYPIVPYEGLLISDALTNDRKYLKIIDGI